MSGAQFLIHVLDSLNNYYEDKMLKHKRIMWREGCAHRNALEIDRLHKKLNLLFERLNIKSAIKY